MKEINVIGLDLAKDVFQVHGIDSDGEVVTRVKWIARLLLKEIKPEFPPSCALTPHSADY